MSMSNQEYLLKITTEMIQNTAVIFDEKFDTESFWALARQHKLEFTIHNTAQFEASNLNHKDYMEKKDVEYADYLNEHEKICAALDNNNIQYRVVKGIVLSQLIYDSFTCRGIGDIDIVVEDQNMERAYWILRDLGYSSAENLGDDKMRVNLGVFFCEIKLSNAKGVFVEIKRGVSAIDTPFEPWFKHCAEMEYNNGKIITLDDYHNVLLLFAQTFINNEGKVIFYKCRLREYFDVAYFICHRRSFNWEHLLKLSEAYELKHQVQVVLKSTNEIYPLPEWFMESVYPLAGEDNGAYNNSFFYYGEDKRMDYNEGLLVQRHKASIRYSIFDKEFSIYQFIKHYKAVLYSKRNNEFLHKLLIANEHSSSDIEYSFNSDSVKMQYQFTCLSDFFLVHINLWNTSADYLESNNVSARVAWYDNDVTSCMLQRYVDTGILKKNDLIYAKEIEIPVITRNYYPLDSDAYNELQNVKDKTKIAVHCIPKPTHLEIQFHFPRSFLFECLDYVAFEIKLVENHNDQHVMSMGSVVNVIGVV